jgi:hypothetical protein
MESALRIVFRDLARVNKNILNKLCHSYKVCVIEDPWAATGGRTLNFWCFHSSIAMSDLIAPGVRSTILASGTLAPLSSFVHEMGM